jgi:L-fuculose-phosphate aldolase
MNWQHPRDEILTTMERIYRSRMTTTSGGNLSIREENGDVWITPARVDKGSLRRDDIILVRADGSIDGQHRPSSELPFHQAIYAARRDVRAIVHAHPVALVAFSICRRVPDTRLLRQSWRICGEVGFAPYALPGSPALGKNIAETFARGFDCVVLENHGVVTAGDSLQQAFERFETLEFAAKTMIKASQLGAVRTLDDAALEQSRTRIMPDQSSSRGPITSLEKERRREICEFVRRSERQRLMISTQGALSARLSDQAFLITPHGVDRSRVEPDDLVLVTAGVPEAGKVPSSSTASHRAIYERQRDVQAIINAYPVNATAFSVSDVPFDSRTIPESFLLLRDVQRSPFGARVGDGRDLADRMTLTQPIMLLDNDGVMVVGSSALDAFDRLEVLEATAEAMIDCRPLGPLVPMPDAVIDELCRAFLPECPKG